jgi:ribonuclease VapC
LLASFLQEFEISILPFGVFHWEEASEAFRRFGKGRHPAALNFGDCLTYATAKLAGRPLLFIGNDFSQTDLDLA